jgi:hypothetical protein
MGVRNDNSTEYVHPDEPNLLNLHKAMKYNANGEPEIRTATAIEGNIIIEGNVNIPGTVTVNSTPEDPIHTHITEIGTSGILDVPFMPISGNVIVSSGNIRITGGNVNANVSGSVIVSSGNVNANVSGSVSVSSGNVTVDGNVGIIGNVTVLQGTIPWSVFGNVEANITGGNLRANVSGSNVTIDNSSFEVTQGTTPWSVSGNVQANITNANIQVTQGTTPWSVTGNVNSNVTGGNISVTGNIAGITSLPSIQANITGGNISVTGNIAGITSLPSIQANITGGNISVTGNIAGITSLPSIQANVTGGNISVTGNIAGITSLPSIQANVTGGNINANVTQGTDPWHVDGNVTITGTSTFTLGTGSTDAFGRLRVSEPYTLYDSKSRYYDHNEFSSSTSTGGNVVYNANSSTFELNVSGSNGSSVIRETKRVFPYQPGKSLLVLSTFCMNTPKTNLRQRAGYFTTNNGIYFENDGTYNYLVIRSYSSGALVEDRKRQDAWDNPFLALQVDRTQIFWTDIEWLGVGSVRCGFVVNGAYVLCHTFHHANVAGNTTTYMTTATLPVRYEITNTAGTTGASVMRQICSTVISEGGYNAFTYSETAGRGTSVLRLSSSGTYYPVVSIRLDSTRLDAIVLPRQVDVLSPTVNYYRWKLMLNPTLTGADWAGHSSSGTVEYDIAATAISGGIELQAGYVSSRELSELGADAFAFQLGRTLAGVSDIVTLAMAATSNNADVLAQIGWQEIT